MVSFFFFFFKQKTAYEISSRDWSSDVCSSDLPAKRHRAVPFRGRGKWLRGAQRRRCCGRGVRGCSFLIAYLNFDHFPTLRLAFISFLLVLNTLCRTTGIWTLPGKRNSIATSSRSRSG